jgi:hypothetical protein
VSAAVTVRDVAHRNGEVLVARATTDESVASEVIRELGLGCRLVRSPG